MEKQVNVIIQVPTLGEFIDDTLEGVEQPPAADPGVIEKTFMLEEFVDDVAPVSPPQPVRAAPDPKDAPLANQP